ncbi:hypothetical protein TrST_g1852 [Triparma strigata]|uniref:Uncharacterized protein n=1 Tax=Triparma strigata TaxID=1606541 RepID=A0A9W7ET47_9STRA|nr:hypothetical protein TrST_g1852 [Triparma strigata]
MEAVDQDELDASFSSFPQASTEIDDCCSLSPPDSNDSADSDLENVYGRLQKMSKSFEGALDLEKLDEQLDDLDSPLFNDDPSDDDSADREFNMAVYGNELRTKSDSNSKKKPKQKSPLMASDDEDDDSDMEENNLGINVVEGPAAERIFRKALRKQQGISSASGLIRCNQLTILQGIVSLFLLIIVVNTSQDLFSTASIIMVSITSALFLATSIRWLRCPNPFAMAKAFCCESKKHVTFETMDSDDLDLEMGQVDNKIGIDVSDDSEEDSEGEYM